MGNVVCYPTTMPSSTILRLCSHVKGEWYAVVCVCVRVCTHMRSVVHFWLFATPWTLCVCVCVCVRAHMRMRSVVHFWLSATPWTVACQSPLPMESSRQGCCNGLCLAAGNFCQVLSASLRMQFFFLWEQLLSIRLTNNNMASLVFIPKLINSKISPKLILLLFHVC